MPICLSNVGLAVCSVPQVQSSMSTSTVARGVASLAMEGPQSFSCGIDHHGRIECRFSMYTKLTLDSAVVFIQHKKTRHAAAIILPALCCAMYDPYPKCICLMLTNHVNTRDSPDIPLRLHCTLTRGLCETPALSDFSEVKHGISRHISSLVSNLY
jgi:hypothetical protein